jgi:uncharacterized membrane protein YkvA (DUF1232 family)
MGPEGQARCACPALAPRDPRVPWHAKLLAVCVAAYALTRIDLIPDFLPVLGYVDDVILVPLGIAMVVWMIPKEIMAEHRAAAAAAVKPISWGGAITVIALWLMVGVGGIWVALG